MVTETKFDSIFDYRSAFKYDSIASLPKCMNRSQYRSAFSYHSIKLDADEDADEAKEEKWISLIIRSGVTIFFYVLVFMFFPFSMWICVKKVHALERIVLMRLGKLQPIRGPGFTFILPIIDIWTRVDLRPQTFTITTSQLLTADGGIIEAKSDIEYQVSDVISYVMKLSKHEKTIKELGLFCLTNIISEKEQDDLENKKEFISCVLKDELNRSSLKWGIEILNVCLYSVKILKAAEPVNALGTLMTALKAATGQSPQLTSAVFPFNSSNSKKDCAEISNTAGQQNRSVIDILKDVITVTENKGLLKDVTASFKFDIVGSTTQTVYCCFKNGHASVIENSTSEFSWDVSLIVTEDNMRDFWLVKFHLLKLTWMVNSWSLETGVYYDHLQRFLRNPHICKSFILHIDKCMLIY